MQDPASAGAVNQLIEICIVGAEGFRASAEMAARAELKCLFDWRAGESRHHADELRALHDQAGAAPRVTAQSVAAADSMPPAGDLGLLERSARGEAIVLAHYRRWLAEPLPERLRVVLQRQAVVVERNHAQLLSLQARARAAGQDHT